MNKLIMCALYISGAFALDYERIGKKIWQNESGCSVEKLLHWNDGEGFLSLGIGHFTWHHKHKFFEQIFPEYIAYLEKKKYPLPAWLTSKTVCPWKTREEFIQEHASQKAKDLHDLMRNTIEEQTKFMIERLEKVAKNFKDSKIKKNYQSLRAKDTGTFALIDYLNFKGSGLLKSERYNNKGWGLYQVLSDMPLANSSQEALHEFVSVAQKLLRERVQNAPAERNEQRWLNGWLKRVERYLDS